MPKRLLFVCLGNICRSPAAEGIFLKLIKDRGIQDKFLVDSAGTGGWHVGRLPDERMRRAAKQRGIVLNSKARQINREDLTSFDLILTMDQDNLSNVKSLASRIDTQKIAIIKPILTFARRTNLMEVPDPYYGGDSGFEKVLDLLEDAIEGLLNSI